jgi:hypothetical protein
MADKGVRRRPATVAAAARERAAGRGNAGQQASVGASPGPRGLPEQLAGDEHGRRALAPGGGGYGGGGGSGWRAGK